MSVTDQGKPTEVKIDRLVLDIPGLDAAEAKALAADVGERLASTGVSAERPLIGITLGPIGGGRQQLAARIAAALRERLL